MLPEKNRPKDLEPLVEIPEPPKKTRVFNKFVIGALIVIAITLGILFKWAFQSEKVLQINNEPFPSRTIREHPTAGGVVILKVDFCKLQDVNGKTRISYFNENKEVFLPLADEKRSKGCEVTEVPVVVPADLQPGTYQVKFRVSYKLNPLKKEIINEFVSQPFTIE